MTKPAQLISGMETLTPPRSEPNVPATHKHVDLCKLAEDAISILSFFDVVSSFGPYVAFPSIVVTFYLVTYSKS